MVVMGEPRTTTVNKLIREDIGHIVRFLPTDSRREVDIYVEAVLLDFWKEPLGYRFRLRFQDEFAWAFGNSNEPYGPMKPWQQIEVLRKPGEVSLGEQAPSGLGDHLDPSQLDALAALRQQSENEN